MVDKYTQTRGYEDLVCREQRQILGSTLPFCEVFDVLGYRFHRDGKGVSRRRAQCVQGNEKLVAGQVHPPFQDCPREK